MNENEKFELNYGRPDPVRVALASNAAHLEHLLERFDCWTVELVRDTKTRTTLRLLAANVDGAISNLTDAVHHYAAIGRPGVRTTRGAWLVTDPELRDGREFAKLVAGAIGRDVHYLGAS